MILSEQEYLVPHYRGNSNVESAAEECQDPTKQKNATADHGFFNKLAVEHWTSLREESPEDFVGDLDSDVINSIKVVQELRRCQIRKDFETLLGRSTVQKQSASNVCHPLHVPNIGSHVAEGYQQFS